jgi:DNA (cytosine-5)-methyltransferase 1
MKILNLYACLGGNRYKWGNEHEITAVELDPELAKMYQERFPNDKVIVADAHQYLLDHYKEFDFIWSSPPCPTHSRIRQFTAVGRGQNEPVYPDMKLYEEIILLQHWHKGKYIVENVIGYYEPLIPPKTLHRHYVWSNFPISHIPKVNRNHRDGDVQSLQERKGIDLTKYNISNKRQILRNCVEREVSTHIIECLLNNNNLFEA